MLDGLHRAMGDSRGSCVGLELAPPCARPWRAERAREELPMMGHLRDESGRVGYLVLYFMGVPIGLILLLWVIFGNNLLTPG